MSNENLRIKLQHTVLDIILALGDGNPGAITVLTQMFTHNKRIDSDSLLGEFTAIFQLDILNMYGPDIWCLYKDLCGEDLVKTIAVLRANQLGFCTQGEIHTAAISRDHSFADSMLAKVQKELPNFGKDTK